MTLDLGAQFAIDVRPDRDRVWVAPVGDLDLLTVGAVEARVAELVSAGFAHVVLDLRKLDFVDCSGVHLVLRLHEESRTEGWRLSVVRGPAAVHRVFELVGADELLPFDDYGLRFSR